MFPGQCANPCVPARWIDANSHASLALVGPRKYLEKLPGELLRTGFWGPQQVACDAAFVLGIPLSAFAVRRQQVPRTEEIEPAVGQQTLQGGAVSATPGDQPLDRRGHRDRIVVNVKCRDRGVEDWFDHRRRPD